jgi:hypothetical protein
MPVPASSVEAVSAAPGRPKTTAMLASTASVTSAKRERNGIKTSSLGRGPDLFSPL